MTPGPGTQTLRDLGEDGLISAITGVYPPKPAWLTIGPGDDSAVLAPLGGSLVVSTDALIEGEDFLRAWSGPHDVGVKLAAQNLADIAAMGARPLGLVVTFAAPGDSEVAWAVEVARGLAEECTRAGAAVIGGDLSAGPVAVLSATALGVLEAVEAVRRDGARPGDVVAVAGVLGRAAAGLQLLFDGFDAKGGDGADRGDPTAQVARALVTAQVSPRPPYAAGAAAARAGAHAMIDTSDGLVRDAARIAAASGVVVEFDSAALAPDVEAVSPVAPTPRQALEWVMSGGEDHAMLACFGPETTLPDEFRPVGRVHAAPTAGADAGDVLLDGAVWDGPRGWIHYRR